MSRFENLTTSVLAVVEVQRCARVAGPVHGSRSARAVLERVLLVDNDLLENAVSFTSAHVRSLDAIHRASARRARATQMLEPGA